MTLLITSLNAATVARYLLELDQSTIEEGFRLDAHLWVTALQNAWERYKMQALYYMRMPRANERQYKLLQTDLKELAQHAQNFLAILTPEAQQNLCLALGVHPSDQKS